MATSPTKIAATAATYSAATLDQDLRSQINTLLLRDDHVTRIQETLLHSLHSHPANWPTVVQDHALSLLRSGEVTSFPALLTRVLDDVRQSSDVAGSGSSVPPTNGTDTNGKKTNGDGLGCQRGLALPQAVVEDALKVARESLEAVCEIEENIAT